VRARAYGFDPTPAPNLTEKINKALALIEQVTIQTKSFPNLEHRYYRAIETALSYARALSGSSPYLWRSNARDWLIVCLEAIQEDQARTKWRGWHSLRFWKRGEELSREDVEAMLGFLKEIVARERGESEPREAFCVVRERR
jgi:hypothetical protein